MTLAETRRRKNLTIKRKRGATRRIVVALGDEAKEGGGSVTPECSTKYIEPPDYLANEW